MRLAVAWVDQVAGFESNPEVLSPSFAQAQVQRRCGLLHNIGKGALGYQEDLGSLNVEGKRGHKVGAVVDVGQDTIDDIRRLPKDGARVGVAGVLRANAFELGFWGNAPV